MSNDIVIEAWNTVLFEKFSRFKFLFVEGYTSISQEVFRRQPFEAGSSVLDIGCGSERVFPLYAELNIPNVVGIDISSTAIKKARRYPNCKVRVMRVEDLDFPPDYFDAVISNAVLRYMPHGKSIIRAISNITEQCKSVLLREPVRGGEYFNNYVHDYAALFQGKMRLEEHYEYGPVDVMIFLK